MKSINLKNHHNFPLPKPRNDSGKLSPSTSSPDSPDNLNSNPFKSAEELWRSNCGILSLQDIMTSVQSIGGSQEEMKARFDKMVAFMEAQIARNSEENRRLAEEVNQLSREVRECGEDIRTIQSMLPSSKNRDRLSREELIDKGESRISSKSSGRRMLLSSRSSDRPHLSKRITAKLFAGLKA